jgi:hypothetical protein
MSSEELRDIQFNREMDESKVDEIDSWSDWEPEEYVLLGTIEEDIDLGRFGVYQRGRRVGWFTMKLDKLPFDDIRNPTIFKAEIADDRIVSMTRAPEVTELYRNL